MRARARDLIETVPSNMSIDEMTGNFTFRCEPIRLDGHHIENLVADAAPNCAGAGGSPHKRPIR